MVLIELFEKVHVTMSSVFFSGEYGQEIFQSRFHKYSLTMTRSHTGDTYTLSGGWEEVYEARTGM